MSKRWVTAAALVPIIALSLFTMSLPRVLHAQDAQLYDPAVEATANDPNVTWIFKSLLSTCPAGDSVIAAATETALGIEHPSRLRIILKYVGPFLSPTPHVGVPPDSIWVLLSRTSGNAKTNDYPVVNGFAKVFANDSTNTDGVTTITVTGFSGCGGMTVDLYVAGTLKRSGPITVRSVDTDSNGVVTTADESSGCQVNYTGSDNGTRIGEHIGHSHRQALQGTLVRRTNLHDFGTERDNVIGDGGISWSPDGVHIAYSSRDTCPLCSYEKQPCRVKYVFSDPAMGNAVRNLTFNGTPCSGASGAPCDSMDYNPTWSPLGDAVYFDRKDRVIYRKPVPGTNDNSDLVAVIGYTTSILTEAAISPDGDSLAYVHGVGDNLEIFIAPATGGSARELTTDTNADWFGPQWSPDGTFLIATRQNTTTHQSRLYKISVHGAPSPTVFYPALSTDGTDAKQASVSPDAQVVVAGTAANYSALPTTHVLDGTGATAASAIVNYAGYTFYTIAPHVSPDGTRLAQLAIDPRVVGAEQSQLWAARRNMSLPPAIASFGGSAFADSMPVVDLSVLETHALTATVSASDPEGDAITYKAHSMTDIGYDINASTGVFTWTPDRSQGGYTYKVRLQAETSSGGDDYVIARIAVSDTTHPGQVTSLAAALASWTSVLVDWTVPGEDGSVGQCSEYDVRYSTSVITAANFGSATQATGESAPPPAGNYDGVSISDLAEDTEYWFAMKARDAAGNWSLMSNVAHINTTNSNCPPPPEYCDPMRAQRAGESLGRRPGNQEGVTTGTLSLGRDNTSRTACAAELRVVGDALKWTVSSLSAEEDSTVFGGDSASIVVQVPDELNGWRTAHRLFASASGSRFALRGAGHPMRYLFRGPNTFKQAWGTVASATPGSVYQVTEARHSRLGDQMAAVDTAGSMTQPLETGDTLTVSYELVTAEADSANDWFLLVGTGSPLASTAHASRTSGLAAVVLPKAFALYANRPNPFSRVTSIAFALPRPEHVRLEVFDLLGRRVRVVASSEYPAGEHSITWDGRQEDGALAKTGVYLCRMTAGTFGARRTMVLLP